MDSATAKHLNELLADSQPVTLTDNCVPKGTVLKVWNGGESPIATELNLSIQQIIKGIRPSVVAAEIRECAASRKKVDICDPAFRPHEWVGRDEIPWYFTRRCWTAARPQIQAVIDHSNATRLAAYEAYRQACEQGVAAPPTE